MFVIKPDYRAPINIQAITKGAVISLFITLILIFATAILIFNMNQGSQWINSLAVAIYLFGCFLGGVIAAKIAGFKGLWHGVGAGIIIFMITFIISVFIVPGHLVFSYILKKFVVSLIAGAIGGILGITLS